MPGYTKLAEERTKKQRDIDRLIAEIRHVEKQIAQLDAYKQLLYETGIPLEEICKQVLKEVGGIISPAEISQEEFVIEFEEQRALVEVKGNTKSISLTDLRQLGHYLEEHEIERGTKIKGLLLGNAWRLLPLAQRTEPDFPPNVVEYAEKRDIALVSTVELHRAYCAMLEGRTEGKEILRRLFAGVGVTLLVER